MPKKLELQIVKESVEVARGAYLAAADKRSRDAVALANLYLKLLHGYRLMKRKEKCSSQKP